MVSALVSLGLVLVVQVPPPDASAALSAELRHAQRAILERERGELEALAGRLDAGGEAAGARAARGLLARPVSSGGATRIVPLAEVAPAPKGGKGLANVPTQAPAARGWQSDLRQIHARAAGALFDLAVRAASKEPKHYALADQCLRLVVERQPDHPEARRLLGFVPYQGGWATPFAVQRLRAGNIPHPTYGWVPSGWVPHLERGELPAPLERGQKQPRWVPAEEADRLHSQWASAWKIPTEHFLIQSNAPLSEAIAFSRQLETFHEVFFSLLADVFGDSLPLARRFLDRKMVGEPQASPHLVAYFATRQQYADRLVPLEGPEIEQTLGIYIPPKRGKGKRAPAYFFRDEKGQLPVSATLYHEVSHQLLFESGLGDPRAYEKNDGNFWVFEGLGTYFETLSTAADGSVQVGGLVGKRIEQARIRLTDRTKRDFIPLERFVRFDQNGLHEGDPYLKYQEANALAVFFMQAEDERYREGFLDYVRDAAKGRLRRGAGRSLEDRLGVPFTTLDKAFLDYLEPGAATAPVP